MSHLPDSYAQAEGRNTVAGTDSAHVGQSGMVDSDVLQVENGALQLQEDELEQLLTLAIQEAESRWADRQRDYERLIDEKSEVIRSLHEKNEQLRERLDQPAPLADVPEGELPERAELLALLRELDQKRLKLQEDEEAMIAQLRDLEMAITKDRAEIARQGAEIQRLQGELRHELEIAQRDRGLRERLGALQRPENSSRCARTSVRTRRFPVNCQIPHPRRQKASPKAAFSGESSARASAPDGGSGVNKFTHFFAQRLGALRIPGFRNDADDWFRVAGTNVQPAIVQV